MRLCTAFSSDAPSTSNALLPLASTQDSFDEVVLKFSPTIASYYRTNPNQPTPLNFEHVKHVLRPSTL